MVERGELRLPEMQRGYVWRAPRVRDLMDSLYRNYPSGAILVWETDEAVPERKAAVHQEQTPYHKSMLLLDGQQRLTSLSAVLRGVPVHVRGRKKPIELLFNLDHPDGLTDVADLDEEADDDFPLVDRQDEDEIGERLNRLAFVISTKKLASQANWVNVSEVFKIDSDAPFLKKAGIEGFDDPRFEKYSSRLKRLRGIRRYPYRMDILERSMSYEEVTEIFVRVNSLGAKLRSSDLAMAQITAKWPESLRVFERFQADCAAKGFDMDLGLHLKNMIAFATGQSRFKTTARLPVEQLRRGWDEGKQAMEFAINFLKSNAKIDSPSLLSSPFLLIALGYAGHQQDYEFTADQEAKLRYWLLAANLKGRFSRGSTETLLDQDLQAIESGKGTNGLLDRLRTQFGRLDVQPNDLEGRNFQSAYFKTMFLAFREDGAKDWRGKLAISLTHVGTQHKLQFHHLFPKAVLRGRHSRTEINDLANLAFIGGKTNRKISKTPPAEYLPDVDSKLLRLQCIPMDKELWAIDAYPRFLAERRRLIADRLNRLLEDAKAV